MYSLLDVIDSQPFNSCHKFRNFETKTEILQCFEENLFEYVLFQKGLRISHGASDWKIDGPVRSWKRKNNIFR